MDNKKTNDKVISSQRVKALNNAEYLVKTIVPLVENPLKKTYLLNQEELNNFLEGYSEYGEFIISINQNTVKSANTKETIIKQIKQYLKDIEETAGQMVETKQPGVRGMQLESIQFRIDKIKDSLELVI